MTLTLSLPDSVEQTLRELASRRGQDETSFVLALIDEVILYEGWLPIGPDDAEEREAADAGIARGLEDFVAGRHRSADEVLRDMKARHAQHIPI